VVPLFASPCIPLPFLSFMSLVGITVVGTSPSTNSELGGVNLRGVGAGMVSCLLLYGELAASVYTPPPLPIPPRPLPLPLPLSLPSPPLSSPSSTSTSSIIKLAWRRDLFLAGLSL
jgi:hypothetical protein